MKFAEKILSALFPRVCEICNVAEAGPENSFICPSCRSLPHAIKWVEEPICDKCGLWYGGAITTDFRCANCAELTLDFEYARAAAEFSGLVKEVIHRFKYSRSEWFEPFLADLLIQRSLPDLQSRPIQVVVPIPLHKRKRHQRGFNQAERLGGRLAEALGIPQNAKILLRTRDTDSQAGLDRDDRLANVRNAFAATGPRLNGETVLLVDDVLTTGLTAGACARELLDHGAGNVRVWTVARGGLA